MELTGSSQIKFIHEYFEQLSVEADSNLLDSNFHKPSQLEIAKNLAKVRFVRYVVSAFKIINFSALWHFTCDKDPSDDVVGLMILIV